MLSAVIFLNNGSKEFKGGMTPFKSASEFDEDHGRLYVRFGTTSLTNLGYDHQWPQYDRKHSLTKERTFCDLQTTPECV